MSKNCKLCGSKHFELVYSLNEQKVVRCANCGLVKTVGKLTVSYENYHRDSTYKEYDEYFKNIFQKRFRLLLKYKKRGRILEIGASTGVLLQIFKEKGWEVWGIEPSESGKIAKSKGIKILRETFEKAKVPKGYFDVVVMNHTLEHVDDPVLVLAKIFMVLKKSGIVYIDVPNFGSLSSQIAGKKWKYLLPNEHIHHFTTTTLEKCLKKAGFKIIWCKTWSGIFDVANPILKFWQTLIGGKKQFFTDIIELPGNIVATATNNGTNLVMIGRK